MHKGQTKQFCPQGHDTFTVGRHKTGACKLCTSLRRNIWAKNNPEKISALSKDWRSRNPERVRVTSKNASWRRYGVKNIDGTNFTLIDYDREYQIQQGRCKICRIHSTELNKPLFVDHDHSTGFFRGLLCQICNSFLGVKENKEWNKKADMYLNGVTNANTSI